MQLHLWTIRTDDPGGAALAARAEHVLPRDERDEALRFYRAADRHQFVIGRALARLALSRQFAVGAGEWRFARGFNGKPFVAAPRLFPAPRFNISHTAGFVACLVACCDQAAVDVERIEHNADLPVLARQICSAAEQSVLDGLTGGDWTARFFEYWTLKEAYAKARGIGLGLALSDIDFDVDARDTIRARFAPGLGDDPSAWMFWRRRVAPEHSISVAAKIPRGAAWDLIIRSLKFDPTD